MHRQRPSAPKLSRAGACLQLLPAGGNAPLVWKGSARGAPHTGWGVAAGSAAISQGLPARSATARGADPTCGPCAGHARLLHRRHHTSTAKTPLQEVGRLAEPGVTPARGKPKPAAERYGAPLLGWSAGGGGSAEGASAGGGGSAEDASAGTTGLAGGAPGSGATSVVACCAGTSLTSAGSRLILPSLISRPVTPIESLNSRRPRPSERPIWGRRLVPNSIISTASRIRTSHTPMLLKRPIATLPRYHVLLVGSADLASWQRTSRAPAQSVHAPS